MTWPGLRDSVVAMFLPIALTRAGLVQRDAPPPLTTDPCPRPLPPAVPSLPFDRGGSHPGFPPPPAAAAAAFHHTVMTPIRATTVRTNPPGAGASFCRMSTRKHLFRFLNGGE